LTIAQADVRLSKNAGADAQKNDVTSCAHEGDGLYMCELDATDTNTVGQLSLWVHVATALLVRHDFQVVEEAVYDAMFAASALGYVANAPVNVAQFGGSNGTFASGRPEVNTTHAAGTAWNSGGITAATLATDTITAAKLASDVATEINAGVLAVLGALADSAADGDPTNADTAMAYLKQLINVLMGTAGIVSYPAAATPGNAVSLAEVIRQIYDEVQGLNGATPLDGAGIRSAVGLASANLDTQLDAIPTDPALPTGAVVADGANTASTFETDLSSSVNDFWTDALLLFTSGSLAGQVKKITDYNGTTKFVTVGSAFTAAPSAADTFVLVNR